MTDEAFPYPPVPYPPAPWRLHGECVLRLQVLPCDRVRPFVPQELPIVPVAPGYTLGGIYLAQYGAGSTLHYQELIVVPALCRRGVRVGAWASHIYVDDAQSLAGGREIWGLPKLSAEFASKTTGEGNCIKVTSGNLHLCTFSLTRSRSSFPVPVYAQMLSEQAGRFLAFSGKGSGRGATNDCGILIPPESPFACLRLCSGKGLQFTDLKFQVGEPKSIGRYF